MLRKIWEAITISESPQELRGALARERADHACTKTELSQAQKALERLFEQEKEAKLELDKERKLHAEKDQLTDQVAEVLRAKIRSLEKRLNVSEADAAALYTKLKASKTVLRRVDPAPIEQVINSADKNADFPKGPNAIFHAPAEKQTGPNYFDEDMDWRLHTVHIEKLKRNKKRFRHVEAKLHARESELLALGWVRRPA